MYFSKPKKLEPREFEIIKTQICLKIVQFHALKEHSVHVGDYLKTQPKTEEFSKHKTKKFENIKNPNLLQQKI